MFMAEGCYFKCEQIFFLGIKCVNNKRYPTIIFKLFYVWFQNIYIYILLSKWSLPDKTPSTPSL